MRGRVFFRKAAAVILAAALGMACLPMSAAANSGMEAVELQAEEETEPSTKEAVPETAAETDTGENGEYEEDEQGEQEEDAGSDADEQEEDAGSDADEQEENTESDVGGQEEDIRNEVNEQEEDVESGVDEQKEDIGSGAEESLKENAENDENELEESIAMILMEEETETVSGEEADADSETEAVLLSVAEDLCQLNLIVLAGDEVTALEGAVFTIERQLTDADSWEYLEGDGTVFTDQDGNEIGAYTSEGDGAISVGSLESGTYRVTQVRTTAGYSLMADALLVTLPRVVTDSGNNLTGTGEVYYYEVTYTIVNTAVLRLPYTGADLGTVWLTGFAGMILVAAAWLMLCGWDRHSRPEIE
ncbi:MAG: hypothetical protein LUE87_06815 [Lachnospiraceae bacterium]|nr:hypothetical protein [Lachnospiraceae bacterium]